MEGLPIYEGALSHRIGRVGRFLGRMLSPFPPDAPDYMSNHYHGAAEMLDAKLDEQRSLDYTDYVNPLATPVSNPFLVDL